MYVLLDLLLLAIIILLSITACLKNTEAAAIVPIAVTKVITSTLGSQQPPPESRILPKFPIFL